MSERRTRSGGAAQCPVSGGARERWVEPFEDAVPVRNPLPASPPSKAPFTPWPGRHLKHGLFGNLLSFFRTCCSTRPRAPPYPLNSSD